jgi:hypothetical protein
VPSGGASFTIAIVTAKRADISDVTELFAVDEFIYIVMAIVVIARCRARLY